VGGGNELNSFCINNFRNTMNLAVIQNKIYEIRGQKIMLDFDLAELYDVETRALNQAVKRNAERFPDDFMFRLTLKNGKTCDHKL
jgi:hypothetical protein